MPKKCYSSSRSHSFFIIAVLFFFVAATADAYDVVLGWDPNAESDLAGYKIYGSEGSPGPPYDLIDTYSLDDIDPDNPTGQISDLDDRSEYYIVVTAYDLEGNESGYSNEVCVAGGIACASDTGDGDGGGGGGGGCLISAAADGPHLAVAMPAVLFFLGFFFICIALGSGHAKVFIYNNKHCIFPEKSDGTIKQAIIMLKRPFLGSKLPF